MNNLFDLGFWFDTSPVRLSPAFEIGFFSLFAVLFMIGLLLRIMKKSRTDKFERLGLGRAATIALTVGFLGLLWVFFSYEEIQIFGMRFWFVVLALGLAISLGWLYRFMTRVVPERRLAEQSKAEANKYLPRANHR